ncbi:SDR family oxidoreductase [Aquabacterium sp.]|uniref:SDR family oxidoreductase n=1 Tax=Aquabacterium sp. TaxID=1872578 RepID=UPI002BDE599E|nr:SDR family oxidoreductase [Aquabacterium sp.]HSW04107.1 SDR family oxidoreductase [Aquabacterium sp.]
MKIVVIGGSGLIGSKLVTLLRARGHELIAASPDSGVNTLTGEGLAEALRGAQVVVDVANSPSFEDQAVLDFFQTSGRNLLAAETAAGVKHHLALSVVGTDRLAESGYFRGKIAQEKLIRESGIPYTIVHSTQFFEFLGGIAQSATQGQQVRMSAALVQPIASDDVAAALADYALGEPVNGVVEIAGPERVRLADLVQRFLLRTKDSRSVVPDAQARYFGAVLQDDTLLPGDKPRIGALDFDAWFALPKAPR